MVHLLVDRVHRLDVVINVQLDLGDSLVDVGELLVDVADVGFRLGAFLEDVVVALVLLQLKGLHDEGEVVVDLLQLLTVELLRLYQLFFDRVTGVIDPSTSIV